MENVNWISMVISTFVPAILGMIYYHKAVLGTAWMNSLGKTEEELRPNNMAVTVVISLVLAFILSFFLINFNNSPGQEGEFDTFKHGAFHGMFLGIVVATPVLVMNGMYEKKSWTNIFIHVGFWILTLVVMGGLLDWMNHWPNEVPG